VRGFLRIVGEQNEIQVPGEIFDSLSTRDWIQRISPAQ
jgi:hypothetical protein